ncbi:unnamed protein product [Lasius platythorax]|uniref:Uncharacterized protein n=1 Tax=Lasius platythorax TaxID=488582 RepID=A0AAV2P6F8_9HYME
MSDVCVGTSVGTITEPECLGPCEPGTSVTLEGIVWHETEGDNLPRRGKPPSSAIIACFNDDFVIIRSGTICGNNKESCTLYGYTRAFRSVVVVSFTFVTKCYCWRIICVHEYKFYSSNV